MHKNTFFSLILACILLSSCGQPSRRSAAYTPESIDLGGEQFTVLCADADEYSESFMTKDSFEEYSFSVYQSYVSAGEAFNTSIEFKSLDAQTANEYFRKSITSAEHLYDVVMLSVFDTARFAAEGFYIDLNTTGVDLSSVWWHAEDDGLTLGDRRCAVYSDITLTGFSEAWVTAINDETLADEIIKLAQSGGFTLDKMHEYQKSADASVPLSSLTLAAASGESFFINDGGATVPRLTERMSETLAKLRSMYADSNPDTGELFSLCEYKMLDGRRFVPLPKLDSDQENYVTIMSDSAIVLSIPITSPDPHAAMCVSDMLTYLMWRDAVPSYLNAVDTDGMLALIERNRRVDHLTVLPIQSKSAFMSELMSAVESGTGEINEVFNKYEAVMTDELSSLLH